MQRRMQRSYLTSDPLQIENSFREKIAALMVRVHGISPDLAHYHVQRTSDAEIEELWQMYVRHGLVESSHQSGLFA